MVFGSSRLDLLELSRPLSQLKIYVNHVISTTIVRMMMMLTIQRTHLCTECVWVNTRSKQKTRFLSGKGVCIKVCTCHTLTNECQLNRTDVYRRCLMRCDAPTIRTPLSVSKETFCPIISPTMLAYNTEN